jgi:penicillin amidase
VVIGHNGIAAFSLTIFCADQQDVMVHETHPDDPQAYMHDGETEAMIRVDEVFAVKGAPDQTLPLHFTRYGPVVHQDPIRNVAVSIRTVFTDPGTAPYMCSLKSMRAHSVADFRDAVKSWGAPSVNLVYADTGGDICWQPAAYIPRRSGWRGLMPVPGDGRYQWQGYLTAADLPAIINPSRGFVHSANEMNVPDTWDHDALPIGHEWYEDGRADRIADVISAGRAASLAGNCALQTDTTATLAARLVALVPQTAPAEIRALLRGWDGQADAGSAAALLFELWLSSHLCPALLVRAAPDMGLRKFLAPGSEPTVVQLLEGGHPALAARTGLDDTSARDAFLVETLVAAWADACARFGADPAHWRWGDLHKGYFDHALTPVRPGFDVGPFAMGGNSITVMMAHYEASDYRVRNGASVRMVVDVGDWDNSLWINAPGQSGIPGDRHYDDLAPLWAKGDYVPMLYTAAAVDSETQHRIDLHPA